MAGSNRSSSRVVGSSRGSVGRGCWLLLGGGVAAGVMVVWLGTGGSASWTTAAGLSSSRGGGS